jgi:hypothetical protein
MFLVRIDHQIPADSGLRAFRVCEILSSTPLRAGPTADRPTKRRRKHEQGEPVEQGEQDSLLNSHRSGGE